MKALARCSFWFCLAAWSAGSAGAVQFLTPGEVVRVAKPEMLLFQGKNFLPAPKGQEFTVLQFQAAQNVAYVAFYKPDGSLIAVSIPAPALEPAPPNAWTDLRRSAEAFRELRLDEARRLATRAAQEPKYRATASALLTRWTGYLAAKAQGAAGRPALSSILLGLRETAAGLASDGLLSLAVPLDEGTDRAAAEMFGVGAVDPALASKLDRSALAKQVALSQRAVDRARQAISLRRLSEARSLVADGLEAEPERPELKAFAAALAKDLREADENYEAAERMRKFPNGTPHALTALDRGLKVCADHPQLLALKAEMSGALEERTAPPVTQALLARAVAKGPAPPLEEGRKLYTTRCTECHDLELLDSRSLGGWEKAVASMARKARLNEPEKARILQYLTVAWNGLPPQ